MHFALTGAAGRQKALAEAMAESYPLLSRESLEHMSYPDCLRKARSVPGNTPRSTMNTAPENLLARTLDQLTPSILVGVPSQIKEWHFESSPSANRPHAHR